MTLLIIGLGLWIVAHLFKRLMPGLRASMPEGAAKGTVALLSLAGIVLMVIGYRAAPVDHLYTPWPWAGHLNNLLMLLSVFLFAAANMKGYTARLIRHKMLMGVVLWAAAHLLVNGDLASLVLFGGMGSWAIVQMLLISAAEPWQRPEKAEIKWDIRAAVGAVIVYAAIAGIHIWLGHNPFVGPFS